MNLNSLIFKGFFVSFRCARLLSFCKHLAGILLGVGALGGIHPPDPFRPRSRRGVPSRGSVNIFSVDLLSFCCCCSVYKRLSKTTTWENIQPTAGLSVCSTRDRQVTFRGWTEMFHVYIRCTAFQKNRSSEGQARAKRGSFLTIGYLSESFF